MDEYLIDLSGVTDRDSLHQCLRDALPLPEWYGNNLDALYDSMTEMSVPVTIRFIGSEEAQAGLGDYFEMFRRVLRDVQSDLPGLTVLFEDSPGVSSEESVADSLKDSSEDSNAGSFNESSGESYEGFFEKSSPENPHEPDLEEIYKAQGNLEDDGDLNKDLEEN